MDGPSWTEFLTAIGILVMAFSLIIGYILRQVSKHDKTIYNPDTGMAVVIREMRTDIRWIARKLGMPSDEQGVGGD